MNKRKLSIPPISDIELMDIYFNDPDNKNFRLINEKRFRLDTNKFSYRIINHWQKEGLISDDRPSGKGWRMYSVTDLVWLHIINDLRTFGYPLEKIKKVKTLFGNHFPEPKEKLELHFLKSYIVMAFILRRPAFLLVYNTGEAILSTDVSLDSSTELESIKNHIQININKIVQKLFPEIDLSPIFQESLNLSKEESELMLLIRMGNFESITVKGKKGQIETIEATEILEANTRIQDLLHEGGYQEITLVQKGGKKTHIKRTIKKKM